MKKVYILPITEIVTVNVQYDFMQEGQGVEDYSKTTTEGDANLGDFDVAEDDDIPMQNSSLWD